MTTIGRRAILMLCLWCVAVLAPAGEPVQGRIRVACIGDSITAGARLEDPAAHAYPARLQRLLGDGYQVINLGVGSCTLIRKGTPVTVWQTLERMTSENMDPDLVVISLGTNDTCGAPRRCWDHKAEFPGDYRRLIRALRALPSPPRIWICAPSPMVLDTPGLSPSRRQDLNERAPRLQELIAIIRQVAAELETGFIDLHTPMADRPDLFTKGDGVHPNRAGYQVIAELVRQGIQGSR